MKLKNIKNCLDNSFKAYCGNLSIYIIEKRRKRVEIL